ncbi:MAG: potassium-transporting ATPase subunit KdpC [Nocardioides sp.]
MRQLWAALRMLIVMTVVVGLAYPLAMTGFAQVVFADQADGSIVARNGTAVGSSLIGQSFDGRAGYFQSRPSAAGGGYDPLASSASNLGPENEDLVAAIEERRQAAADLDGTDPDEVAPDALLASGSGLDPHISPEYAEQQVARIARERDLSEDAVRTLVEENTGGRAWGFLGEPHVNVLLLNVALDEATEQAD